MERSFGVIFTVVSEIVKSFLLKKALYVEQKSSLSSQAANLGYEIPARLYSLLKPTRTLIAKAIGRELFNNSKKSIIETSQHLIEIFND